jgi:hypothetical protein
VEQEEFIACTPYVSRGTGKYRMVILKAVHSFQRPIGAPVTKMLAAKLNDYWLDNI